MRVPSAHQTQSARTSRRVPVLLFGAAVAAACFAASHAHAAGNPNGGSSAVVITARADPVQQGGAAGLSLARAHGVADDLEGAGVDPQRIVLQAVGDTQPHNYEQRFL